MKILAEQQHDDLGDSEAPHRVSFYRRILAVAWSPTLVVLLAVVHGLLTLSTPE